MGHLPTCPRKRGHGTQLCGLDAIAMSCKPETLVVVLLE